MVSLAKKLKDVVAANFVEISRPEKDSEATKDAAAEQRALARQTDDPLAWKDSLAAETANRVEELALIGLNPAVDSPEALGEPPPPMAVAEDLPVVEAPVIPEDPLALIGDEGAVDFDAVFQRMGVSGAAAFSAEQALTMLMRMPSDLPLKVKRLTVKTTLDAVGQAVGATPGDIVADAERKKDGLNRFIDEVSVRAMTIRAEKEAEIENLRSEIMVAETKRDAAIVATHARIENFDQVVAFFTAGEPEFGGPGRDKFAGTDDMDLDGELPPFLREDAVMRLLGIHSGNDDDPENEPAKTT